MTQPFAISVFCGARLGQNPAHGAAAYELGQGIAAQGWRLVFGGGGSGLMERVSQGVLDGQGDVIGVTPVHLHAREASRRDLNTLIVTETMHERKKVMFMNSDAIVLLPGGVGSLDEIFEIITWAQLGLHNKQIVIVNVAGFWDPLLALLDHLIAEGFAEAARRETLQICKDVPQALQILQSVARR